MASLFKGHMTNMTSNWILQISQKLKIGISKRGQGACHWLKISAAVTLAMSAAGVLNIKMDMQWSLKKCGAILSTRISLIPQSLKNVQIEMIN